MALHRLEPGVDDYDGIIDPPRFERIVFSLCTLSTVDITSLKNKSTERKLTPSELHYRPEIDGLRAIAILLVLIFHLFPQAIPGGFVGVDVFFVISGYLITTLIIQRYQRGTFTLLSFYRARIARLFPALLLVLGSSIIWSWFYLLPIDLSRLGRHLASTIGFFENFTLRQESGYFEAEIALKPLAHMWSLSIEEQFYLAFPLIVLVIRANRRLCLIVIPGLALGSLLLNIFGVRSDPTGAYFLPWMRAFELLTGALLFYLPLAKSTISPYLLSPLALIGLALILISAFVLDDQTPFPGAYAMAPVVGAALVIWIGRDSGISRWLLSHPMVTGLGLISYPLYLWHWPLLAFLNLWPGFVVNTYSLAAIGVLSILLSLATYHWVEKPLRRFRNRSALLKALILLAIVFAAMGVGLSRMKGFPDRYPDLPIELAIEKSPFPKTWRFNRCFLLAQQTASDFAPECFAPDPAIVGTSEVSPRKRILLWGDSYAAQLYPGLAATWGKAADITQLTAMACAPIMGLEIREYPHCPEIIRFVLEHIKTHTYDTIIIAGNWDGIFKHGRQDLFENTIRHLRETGIRNLVIYGPPPLWRKDLPKIMLEAFMRDNRSVLPNRMVEALDDQTLSDEAWLQGLSGQYDVGYVSLYKPFCNEEGCLVRIHQNLTSMDNGHLTETASQFLFEQIPHLNGDYPAAQ